MRGRGRERRLSHFPEEEMFPSPDRGIRKIEMREERRGRGGDSPVTDRFHQERRERRDERRGETEMSLFPSPLPVPQGARRGVRNRIGRNEEGRNNRNKPGIRNDYLLLFYFPFLFIFPFRNFQLNYYYYYYHPPLHSRPFHRER